jgi:hypothetical protein
MPPIPAHFLDSVVFLYPSRDAAETGRGSGGSGFLASIPVVHDRVDAPYIVTNDHVAIQASAARLTSHDGTTRVLDTPLDGWHSHPDGDDVAVFPLALAPEARYLFSAIPWGTFVHMSAVVAPGDDVFFLGRYVALDGTQTDGPVARFGHLALQGTAKVRQAERAFDQESFMVEALSVSGYSGSPVAIYRLHLETPFGGGVRLSMGEPGERRLQAQQGTAGTPALLGITWGHHHERVPVYEGGQPVDGQYVIQNRGIANVVPAWKITELLNEDDVLARKRQQQRREYERLT